MTLGAYSSRIARSVGCAALTLLLAATTCPTLGAPTARPVESLSAAERASLPDTALIKFKTGRTVSLGVLRTEHKLRLQRFADAAKLGKEHAVFFGPATHGVYAVPEAHRLTPQGTLVPMRFSCGNSSTCPHPLPGDFVAFCQAALVTVCLYFPSGVPLSFGSSFAGDADPFITDQNVCEGKGGQITWEGCTWWYPIAYGGPPFNSQGLTTAQGYNATQSANCPSPFVNTFDPRGYVNVSYNTSNINPDRAITFPVLQSCVAGVYVTPARAISIKQDTAPQISLRS
jgi:hypothetical protein